MNGEQILLVEVGSGAHGTGLPGYEDHDETSVEVETPAQVFAASSMYRQGQRNRMERTAAPGAKSQPHDTDRQVYGLRSFLALAAKGNPSILMCLWAPVIETTDLGTQLRDMAPAFLGRHLVDPHRGYMRAQTLRLLGLAGNQGHGPHRPELIAKHGYDTKYAMHAARLGYQCDELLRHGRLTLPMVGEVGDWLRAVRRGEVPFEEWWERVLGLDRLLEIWGDSQRGRPGPDLVRIEAWSQEAHRRAWGW